MVEMMGFAPSLRERAPLLRRLSRANSYKRATGTFAPLRGRNSTSSVRIPLTCGNKKAAGVSGSFEVSMVEMMGFEPTTPTLRT